LYINQFDSGHGKAAHLALPMLEELFDEAKSLVEDEVWGLTLMPGSGINAKSVAIVLESLLPRGLCEIHLSGGKWVESEMEFRRDGMGMGSGGEGDWGIWVTQEDEIRRVREVADAR
jgi:copper homeostasis protein